MRIKITLLIVAILLVSVSFAQKKPALFGVAFNIADFNTLNDNSNTPTAAGASLYYWKGINRFIDLTARLNGIFNDYDGTGKNKIGAELEPSLVLRPLKDEKTVSPFVSVGIGGGVYSSHSGAYVPFGAGLQVNARNTTYFFLQGQYKWAVTANMPVNNLFYSIGFAERLSKGNSAPVKKMALPAAPAINDTDGDGIANDADECPDVKGIAAFKGCPDTDGDGIPDKDDKCPDIKGLSKYGGCPVPDSDNDGINDDEDQCPKEAGLARYQGCPIPDTDQDGINDEEDRCPTQKGPASNRGCPAIDIDIIRQINKAAASIAFAAGSDKLLPGSFASLNTIAAILKSNPNYKLEINGYTDNQGSADKKQALSEAMASAVNSYLVKKGIDENRLSIAGFADENPVADNNTSAGRARNRRVEIKLRNY